MYEYLLQIKTQIENEHGEVQKVKPGNQYYNRKIKYNKDDTTKKISQRSRKKT